MQCIHLDKMTTARQKERVEKDRETERKREGETEAERERGGERERGKEGGREQKRTKSEVPSEGERERRLKMEK